MATYISLQRLQRFWNGCKARFFPYSGGEITGNVKIDGNLTLDIEDEDYDAGITFSKSLDNNAGTVLTLQGYANGEEATTYRPVIRGIANPVSDYDVANKRYVDSKIVTPASYIVFLNEDGSISTYSSTISYTKIKAELTDYTKEVFLDVIYNYTENGVSKNTRVHVPAMQDMDVNAGPIVFLGSIRIHDGNITDIVFLLDSNNVLTNSVMLRENALNKVTNLAAVSASQTHYPSVAGVWNTFERKPEIVWEVQDVSQGLLALNANISENLAWQLTGLNLAPYSRIKIFAKAGRKTSSIAADSSITPAVILEMSLDDRAKETVSQNVFIGSILFQNPNDANRLGSLTCAVSADKTKFAVTRATSLYGTAATSNTDTYQYVFKIEGFYD